MGRMIDADKVIECMQYYHDDCAKTSVYTRLGFETAIEVVKDAPTVEAIPKANYEARLKADMVAMLTEIQLELDEMKITKVRSAGFAPYSKDPFRRGVNCSKEIIQEKINDLRGSEDVR